MSEITNQFISDMESELSMADAAHGTYNSYHEAYAVILEELDEFWDIVKMKRQARDHAHAYVELVQIAVTCMRTARDLKLRTLAERDQS